ncbi:Protein BPS1 [Cardamine amara subsp. amara]|uniref:Protein BPS1 n=1 Tax=Cardamine amara subsp. amara TaxID=228776 RepID=A0ABD0ZBT5_CARAN
MSRAQDPPRGFFPFGNPFRMLSPKGSDLSSRLLSLLNGFEVLLTERLKKLMPKNKDDILTLTWMKLAMESLCETHSNINTLITDLQLPVSDWEEKWVDVYLNISVKLLDLCNAFSSELTRLNQGDLFLKCALHNLQSDSGEKYLQARSSLDSWRQHVNANNHRIENCRAVLDSLVKSLSLPKVKNSPKGKVLMRAFYGVKVQTVYICSVFTAAWSDSSKDLFDLRVSEKPLWAKVFTDMQSVVNDEIRDMFSSGRTTILKELESVDASVEKLYPMIQDGIDPVEVETFKVYIMELGTQAEKLSQGLDQLLEEVDSFFKMTLSGRDVLLCNLRSSDSISGNSVGEDVGLRH